jgi:hypothetical protein
MRHLLQGLCLLTLVACGQNPQEGDGGDTPLDVVAGWSGSPTMNPGLDCLSCHCQGSPTCYGSYKPWSIAGTVFSSPDAQEDAGQPNVEILITDANGGQLTLISNSAGNFYTQEPLAFPLKSLMLQNKTHRMQMNVSTASPPGIPNLGSQSNINGISDCNSCHTLPSDYNAPGRLFVEP